MTYWLPCSLTLIFSALFAAIPWGHPHPNHLFMLDLLDAAIGGHPAVECALVGQE